MSTTYHCLWKSSTKKERQTYSDIEMMIIDDAHQQKQDQVALDNCISDRNQYLQIDKMDTIKHRPITRISSANLHCLREGRFTLPTENASRTRSFGDEPHWITPRFIEEYFKRNPCRSIPNHVEKAARGILDEGHLLGETTKSQWLANALLGVKDKSWDDIASCALYIYTRESFLYGLLNKTLREEDLSKVDTLGPFCDILWNSLSSDVLKSKYQFAGVVYRCASLNQDEINDYKSSIGKNPKEWLGFSSASKNRDAITQIYERNTLFIINVPSQSQHLDISTISQFPQEEEVLLGPSTSFQIENVEHDNIVDKHYIYLGVLW